MRLSETLLIESKNILYQDFLARVCFWANIILGKTIKKREGAKDKTMTKMGC